MEEIYEGGKSMTARFWDSYARRYDAITVLRPYKHMISDIAMRIPEHCKTVLDAGCGTGELLAHIANERPEIKLSGIDFSPAMLHLAQVKVPHAELKQGDLAASWPIESQSTDVTISVNTLYAIASPVEFLSEMRRVTKAGGKIIVSTPKKGAKLLSLIVEHLKAKPGLASTLEVVRMIPAVAPNLKILNKAHTGNYHFLTAKQITDLANPDLLATTYAAQNWLFEVTVE